MSNYILKQPKHVHESAQAPLSYEREITITKDGIEVKVGQIWRDLDKRMDGRTRKVIEVKDGKAVMQSPHQPTGMKTKVSIKRMHKSSTGWELVSDVSR